MKPPDIQPETETPTPPTSRVTELAVSGMNCSNCARHVTEAIQQTPGVQSAVVNLETARASVRWAGAVPDVAAVIQAVKAKGYGAKAVEPAGPGHDHGERKLAGWQLNLWIGVLGTVPIMIGEWGFRHYLGGVLWFQWLSFALAGIVQAVAGAQFYRGAWSQLKIGRSNMDTLVALGSTTAFAFSAWTLLSGRGGHVYFMEAASIITLISIGHWMESRVSVRASSALRKLLNLAPPTARRINLSSISRRQEAPSSQSAIRNPQSAISQSLLTSAATNEEEIPVAELRAADLVSLRPGDRVPTDGEVAEGDSAVDEAMLTGESAPVEKSAGSRLYAGTVNLNGRLVMRVTATGEETALAHIIAAVQRAQSSRANIQRIGDRVSNVFVPVVVLVALAAGLWWGIAPESALRVHAALAPFLWAAHPPAGAAAAFIIAAAVLIIACPCAMGLATPAAIMAGSNAAAQRGILIRDGLALEKAGEVTAVIFDKTGTVTVGKPVVAQVWENGAGVLPDRNHGVGDEARSQSDPQGRARHFLLRTATAGQAVRAVGNHPDASVGNRGAQGTGAPYLDELESLLPGDLKFTTLAAALARHSTHPVSQAIARAGSGQVEFSDWQEVRGAGVKASVKDSTFNIQHSTSNIEGSGIVRLGAVKWLGEEGVDLAAGGTFVAEWAAQGATIVGLAAGTSLLGLFAVKDALKPGAAGVIGQLQRQGLKTFLVTGDNALSAAGIARQAGIAPENVFAEVRPEQKAEFVKKLQRQGERVAFVGDGINDAPALEQADLGIAVSRASDIAREAADIILLNSEIEAVPESLGLARATLRTIKQNLFWAFFYNAIGVPLAALGFMSPILCAAAMGFSDLIVIGNALRLRRWKLRG